MSKDILIFAKPPVAGQSKTRLIPLLGAQGAVEAGAELTTNLLKAIAPLAGSSPGFDLWLWGASAHPVLKTWAEQFNLRLSVQGEGGLGQRMRHCLTTSLEGGAEQALLIGSDCPVMNTAYLRQASTALERTDLVLGPAQDGGYVLIGCKAMHDGLFEHIDWGTDRVLAQTVAKAQALELSVTLLETLWDVDRPEDWLRYRRLGDG
jgi:rSAM/selenodomain-associated transferase 1